MAQADRKPYLLTVLTGPNAGAQEKLSRGRFTIAGDGNADFLLDGISTPPLEVAIVKGRMRLLSDRDDIRILGVGRCVRGVATITELPATVEIGGAVQIHLCQQAATKKPRGMVRRTLATVGCLALIGAVVLGVAGPRNPVFGEAMANILSPAAPEQAATQLAAITPAPVAAPQPARVMPTLDDARAMLDARIAKDGLDDLNITASDGALRVTGTISKRKASAWGAIRVAYEKQFGQIAPLLTNIEEVPEVAPVAIASIWLGSTPEFTTPQGEVMGIGDETESGWTVIAITPAFVALERGEQRAMVEI